jgi:pimeloyl-ACP methyl ester carboxylesterase
MGDLRSAEDFELKLAGLELKPHQTFEPAQTKVPRGIVLLAHHWGGNRHSLLRLRRFYRKLGYDVLSMDFRFHGSNWLTYPYQLRKQWQGDFVQLAETARRIASQRGYSEMGFHARSSFASVVLSVIAQNVEIRKDYQWGVLECGPFMEGVGAWYRLARIYYKIPAPLAVLSIPLVFPVWDSSYNRDIKRSLELLHYSPLPMKYMVLAAADDKLVPLADLKKVASQLGAKLEVFDGAGHLEILKSNFIRFSKLINQFVEK